MLCLLRGCRRPNGHDQGQSLDVARRAVTRDCPSSWPKRTGRLAFPARMPAETPPTPSFGIEPVPERLRVLGALDGFLLWSNLSVSLLVIVAGAFLVLPASQFGLGLSLPVALAATVAAAVVGNILLGVGGLIGADARVPTMVLFRAPLGRG